MFHRRSVSILAIVLIASPFLSSVAFARGAQPTTWYVAVDGADTDTGNHAHPFATIQFAIDEAASGDIILVADGTYSGEGNRDLTFRGKDLVLRSQSGDPESCTIDCQGGPDNEHRGVVFEGSETRRAVLSGFTIRGGDVSGKGGGILCRYSGVDTLPAPLIENCIAICNRASVGGGIAVVGASVPRLVNCRFVANIGGGGFWGCESPSWCTPGASLVESCRFVGNTGHGIETGGDGFEPWNRDLRFYLCTIANNSAKGVSHANPYGLIVLDSCEIRDNDSWGVTFPFNGRFDRAVRREEQRWGSGITDCAITGNGIGGIFSASEDNWVFRCVISDNHGPGITLYSGYYWPAIVDCTIERNEGYGILVSGIEIEFHGNVVRDNATYGVRIAWSGDSPLEVAGNMIAGNGGAGLEVVFGSEGGTESDFLCRDNVIVANGGNGATFDGELFPEPAEFVRNTIAGNALHGVECLAAVELHVTNTVIAFNQGEAIAGDYLSSTDLNCADLYGNALGDYTGDLIAKLNVQGNFAADPFFCTPGAGEFGLRADSPCAAGNHPSGADCGLIGALEVSCTIGGLPYLETFDDGAADGFEVVSGIWSVADGLYHCNNGNVGQTHVATVGETTWSDYRFECDIRVAGAPEHEVLFRYQSPGEWYLFGVLRGPDGGAVLRKCVGGVVQVLAQLDNLPDTPDQWHHLAVEVQGPMIRAYDNGTLVFCYEDAEQPFLAGKVGLTAFANPEYGWQEVFIDNVSVQAVGTETDVPEIAVTASSLWSYPNPFNPQTRITFRLTTPGRVSLAVYDLQGRLVRRLLDESLPDGQYDVEWNGRNASGLVVPAGTYFCRLMTPAGALTRKMNLVK